MKHFRTALGVAALLGLACNAFAQFTPGNLVVSIVDSGNPNLAPSSAANRVRLVELFRIGPDLPDPIDGAPTGQVYDLPIGLSGLNHRLTLSGTALGEGQITLSADSKYLLITGYDAPLGTANVFASASASVNRVVGRIDYTKPPGTAINTTTSLNNVFSGGSIFGAASAEGVAFFLAGAGGTQGAVAAANLGAATGTPGYGGTVVPTVRAIGLFKENLYAVGGSLAGVAQVTAGQTTLLPGFPTTPSSLSSQGFYFLDPETLYVADDTNSDSGGIQKWQKFGGVWELSYTLNIPAAVGSGMVGVRALAGSQKFDENANEIFAQLYAITTDNRLVEFIDDNPGAQPFILASGSLSQVFRGVEVIRPTTVSVGGFVTLQGAVNIQIPLHVDFRDPITNEFLFSRTVTIAPDSSYTVDNVPAGRAYDLHIKADKYLAVNHPVNTFSINDRDADVTLLAGDANNDNTVDIADLLLLVAHYNQVAPAAGYLDAADLNNDGANDIQDLLLLIGNYNQMGEG